MILVTGSRGFIGSHFMEIIGRKEVYEVDLKNPIGRDILDDFVPPGEVTHVVHFAAKRSVPAGEKDPLPFVETNCWGTLKLMRQFPDARFLNISSGSVNDIQSIYGATKAFAELCGRMHKNCLSIRLYNVFGERQPLESGAVFPAFCKARMEGKRPIIYGDGRQRRDFTYVKDVALGIKGFLNKNNVGVYHLGYSYSITIRELAQKICGEGVDPDFQPPRGAEIDKSTCPVRINDPKYGRAIGISRTIEYYDKTGF